MGLDMYAMVRNGAHMGLDMYAMVRNGVITEKVDFKGEDGDAEVFYWRKHPDLHGWMKSLYYSKGGVDESFNCVNVLLEEDNLVALRDDIVHGRLPRTEGFFFGTSYNDADSRARDLEFVDTALTEIRNGNSIYYTSWW